MHCCALCATKAYNVEEIQWHHARFLRLQSPRHKNKRLLWDFPPFATAMMDNNRWLNNPCNIKQRAGLQPWKQHTRPQGGGGDSAGPRTPTTPVPPPLGAFGSHLVAKGVALRRPMLH